MNLRPYKSSDLESVAHLFTASIHGLAIGHYDASQRAAWAPQPPDLSEWDERLNGLHTVVAENDDNELAGFLSYAMNGYIGLLYVSPRYPRRGVASLLYHEIESTLLLLCGRRRTIHRSDCDGSPILSAPKFSGRGRANRQSS